MRINFRLYEGNVEDLPPGYQEVIYHIIFDVKMGKIFCCKHRMISGYHKTTTPYTLNYLSVVYQYSVQISLTTSALNDLKVLVCDINNVHLTAKVWGEIWNMAGPEFSTKKRKLMLDVRALYGLKLSGEAFRAILSEPVHYLGYRPSIDEPDFCMRLSVKPGRFI